MFVVRNGIQTVNMHEKKCMAPLEEIRFKNYYTLLLHIQYKVSTIYHSRMNNFAMYYFFSSLSMEQNIRIM